MTPDETKRFSDKHKAKMQLRGKLLNGKIFGNKPQLITVYPINEDFFGSEIEGTDFVDGWIVLDGGSVTTE